jgi:hypothetical protein
MAKRKKIKEQTMINKTLHRKLKIGGASLYFRPTHNKTPKTQHFDKKNIFIPNRFDIYFDVFLFFF